MTNLSTENISPSLTFKSTSCSPSGRNAANESPIPDIAPDHIVVHEDYRRLGIGRKLFDVLLERARQEEVNIKTTTFVNNTGTIKFCEKLGFKPLTLGLLLALQKRIIDK
ncbi:MAG: GNAT family N-acetyltransferase [Promethearchaeota archaeon]